MDVKGIVCDWLKTNGYDGLYDDEDVGCACAIDDLVPCGEGWMLNCKPGYKVSCDGTCDDGKCDFHMAESPPPKCLSKLDTPAEDSGERKE